MEELEEIQNDKIRDFVAEALSEAPEWMQDNTSDIEQTKSQLNYSKVLLDVLDADDYTNDIVTSAILLQDLTKYVFNEEQDTIEDPLHPLSVRIKLLPLMSIIGVEAFDDILRTVESSHGYNSPIPQVMPGMNDPVYIWIVPFANQLAKEAGH
jgi:hypothetical protein